MFSQLRQQEIYKIILEKNKVRVAELSKLFDVTLETIRSDLKQLESRGLIERCHGGAILAKQEIRKVSQFSDDFNVSFLLRELLISSHEKSTQPQFGDNKLCVIGSFVIDIIAQVDHFPRVSELVESSSNYLSPGGKGTNQAHVACYAQTRVHLVTKVGNDPFNKYAYKYIKESGIDSFTIFQSDEEPTGSSIIYRAEQTKDNLTATYLGANQTLSEKEIDTVLPYISDANALLLQGEVSIRANLYAAEFAKQINKIVILNVAPFNQDLKQLYPFVDHIVLNALQASSWSDVEVIDSASAAMAARAIAGDLHKCVVVILPDFSVVYFDGKALNQSSALPSAKEDTMGAYDAFCGAYSSAITKGESVQKAVGFASAFTAAFIEKKGVTSMPIMSTVMSRMEQFKSIKTTVNSETRFEI